jgi:hypothetical protein
VAGSAPARSSSGCRRLGIALAVALSGVAHAGDVAASLDALVALQRPAGGWTFASAPGARPEPFTLVVKTAERLLAPVGLATWDLVVVRSPGTPAAGLLLLDGHRRTGREAYLGAARRAGDFLVATQLPHGGWFSELPVYGTATPWWFRRTADLRAMLDDDVTPGAIRFLLELWAVTGDLAYRDAAERAIALMEAAQLPSGAWPLDARPAWLRRLHPHFEDQPALNDGATPFAITTFVAAARMLGRPELMERARRAGDWLVRVQGADPRAGWAQQYGVDGAPATARPFEVPALASWETRHAIEALLVLADATGDRRWCRSAIAAARWLDDARVGPACWARFYDVASGVPVFVDAGGERVASSADARPGYAWMGEFGISWTVRAVSAMSGSVVAGYVLADGSTGPAYRLPGDPGGCAQDPRPPRPLAGARAAIASAATALALGRPSPGAACRDVALP